MADMEALTEREQLILAIEKRSYHYAGSKESAIRAELGMTATRYYQILNVLMDKPAALVAEPQLIHRLHRLRDQRQQNRSTLGA